MMDEIRLPTSQRGYTLVELMIALLALSAITYAALSLYVTQHKQLLVQEEISDMQANVRAVAVEMANQIRMAGFNMPKGFPAIETDNTDPDTITIFYNDLAQEIHISEVMPAQSTELKCVGSDLSGLTVGDTIYIYSPWSKVGEYLYVTAVQDSAGHIGHDTKPLTGTYPKGSKIVKIRKHKYYIDQSDIAHPNLMLKVGEFPPEIFAEDIINLDFTYYLSTGAVVWQTDAPETIRMVEVDVTGRTASLDPDFQGGYRTRNFTLRVKLRNFDAG